MHNIDNFTECYSKFGGRPTPIGCSAIVSATENLKTVKIKYITLAKTDDRLIHESYLFYVEGKCV